MYVRRLLRQLVSVVKSLFLSLVCRSGADVYVHNETAQATCLWLSNIFTTKW